MYTYLCISHNQTNDQDENMAKRMWWLRKNKSKRNTWIIIKKE